MSADDVCGKAEVHGCDMVESVRMDLQGNRNYYLLSQVRMLAKKCVKGKRHIIVHYNRRGEKMLQVSAGGNESAR